MCHFTFSFYIFFSYSQNTDFSVASCPLLILFLVHWWTFGGFHILHSALLVYLEVHWDPYFQGDLEILINGYDWSARIGLIGKQFEWEGFRTHFKARHSPWSKSTLLTTPEFILTLVNMAYEYSANVNAKMRIDPSLKWSQKGSLTMTQDKKK